MILKEMMGLRLTSELKKKIAEYMKHRRFTDRDKGRAIRELLELGLKTWRNKK